MSFGGPPPPFGPGGFQQPQLFGGMGGGPGSMPPAGTGPPVVSAPAVITSAAPVSSGPVATLVPPGANAGTVAVKTREMMYTMIVSQLFYDGYSQVAMQLTNMLQLDQACPPSDRLLSIFSLGLEREIDVKGSKPLTAAEKVLGPGLDLEFETEVTPIAPEPALYETAYVTSHKGHCRAGAFSPDGNLCATGSIDASIKILDVDRMLAKSNQDLSGKSTGDQSGHPVIRTLYDHVEEVTTLDFHPKEPLLASGSRDFTIKLFDYSKASAKKAASTITDSDQITTIAFHPTGDYLLAGSEQQVIRMYDVNTGQCFVGRIPSHQHVEAVTSVRWSADGRQYVSASIDGTVKVWDGVSSQCRLTFANAHDGAEVSSACFTRNGKYVLSAGKNSQIKLWELSTNRCLILYTGAGATGKQEYRAQAVFNHTEDYVMYPDEATTSLCCWDARNASRKQLLSLGHNGTVRYIVHSPTSPAFLTCSDDFRARFWYKRGT